MYKKDCFTKSDYLKICPTGSKPGILYEQVKAHKPVENNCPSVRRILSAIGTPTYDLVKFLVPIFKLFTEDEHTVHNLFSFANKISKFYSKNLIARLDVGNLFTNVPLEETIYNTMIYFWQQMKFIILKGKNLNNFLLLQHMDSFFIFDGEYYTQIDGVAMGSPLGQTVANTFCVISRKNGFQNAQ